MLAGKHLTGARLQLPESVIKNLEIIDRAQLQTLLVTFFREHQLQGRRLLLVLDASVTFQKVIALDQSGKPDLLLQSFVDAMPFDAGQRACLAVETAGQLRLFATNAELYTAITEAIHTSNAGKLVAITPGAAYELKKEDRSLSAAAEHFFADATVRKLADFRSVTPT